MRHDGHALIAAGALLLAGTLIALSESHRRALAALAIGLAGFSAIAIDQGCTWLPRLAPGAILGTYAQAFAGARSLVARDPTLEQTYQARWRELAQSCGVPVLRGRADVYSHQQACLLASGADWRPRPVFQSYTAYTPALAELNARHLEGDAAPHSVLFRPEPIDGRLPALEDGASWPALIDRYDVRGLESGWLVLERSSEPRPTVPPRVVAAGEGAIGEEVALPSSAAPLLAEIELEPTLLGRVRALALRPPPVWIELRLASGELRTFRFLPGLARSRFVLSPLVTSAEELVALARREAAYLERSTVASFRIILKPRHRAYWSDRFALRVLAADLRTHSAPAKNVSFDPPEAAAPAGALAEAVACEGSIDALNGAKPVPEEVSAGRQIEVAGWSAVSTADGVLPDELFLSLDPGTGDTLLFRTRPAARPDVRDHYGHPALFHAGFTARIDTSKLGGRYALGVVQQRGRELVRCAPVRRVVIREVPRATARVEPSENVTAEKKEGSSGEPPLESAVAP